MEKKTIEVHKNAIAARAATEAAWRSFGAVMRTYKPGNIGMYPGLLSEALFAARSAAMRVAREFHVEGKFEPLSLTFTIEG